MRSGIVAEFSVGDDAFALAADGDGDFALADSGNFAFDNLAFHYLGKGGGIGLLDFFAVFTGYFPALESFPVEVLRVDGCVQTRLFDFFVFCHNCNLKNKLVVKHYLLCSAGMPARKSLQS